MRVISVNVGLPRTVQWKGKAVSTGIFKAPVSGRIHSRTLNLDGDRQADLSVHGGAGQGCLRLSGRAGCRRTDNPCHPTSPASI